MTRLLIVLLVTLSSCLAAENYYIGKTIQEQRTLISGLWSDVFMCQGFAKEPAPVPMPKPRAQKPNRGMLVVPEIPSSIPACCHANYGCGDKWDNDVCWLRVPEKI